jgi:hypothetical protein
MTPEQIGKFVEAGHLGNQPVKISFKTRNALKGIFIRMNDYQELKSKNFWRIVSESYIPEWEKTGNSNLARIFNGAEITRLS